MYKIYTKSANNTTCANNTLLTFSRYLLLDGALSQTLCCPHQVVKLRLLLLQFSKNILKVKIHLSVSDSLSIA